MQAATYFQSESLLTALLKDYAYYNLWANKTIIDWLKPKPAKLIEQQTQASFGSLKLTLLHIWNMQTWWQSNLQQWQPEFTYSKIYNGTIETIFEGILKQSEELAEYVDSLNDDSLEGDCPFNIPTVGEFNRPRFEAVHHCINQSTYHRGQLVAIAHNLGIKDAPQTDYMHYLLTAKLY